MVLADLDAESELLPSHLPLSFKLPLPTYDGFWQWACSGICKGSDVIRGWDATLVVVSHGGVSQPYRLVWLSYGTEVGFAGRSICSALVVLDLNVFLFLMLVLFIYIRTSSPRV